MAGEGAVGSGTRYHSLEGLRAAAMLLAVAWHAVQGSRPETVATVMDWLHSFRKPLFMLISGFFGHMMLVKYGLGRDLTKRWWRVGMPMLIGLFSFMRTGHVFGRPSMSAGRPPLRHTPPMGQTVRVRRESIRESVRPGPPRMRRIKSNPRRHLRTFSEKVAGPVDRPEFRSTSR
jgi:hypothetical protein